MANWFIVEGETEEHFLRHYKKELSSLNGKIKICNCWQQPIYSVIRDIKISDNIFVLFDTDVINEKTLEKFHKNINSVAKIFKDNLFLLQQTLNFEDELVRSCENIPNKNELCKQFNASSLSEFKENFIALNNVVKKLNSLGFSVKKIWRQTAHESLSQNLHKHLKNGEFFLLQR